MKSANYSSAIATLITGAALIATMGAAQAKPDLVVNISALPTIVVKNIGTSPSRTQYTTVHCQRLGAGSCAESPAMAPYEHPAYPNRAAVKISSLKPGQSHVHTLTFWNSLKRRPDNYRFTARADDGNNIPESNEANNGHMVIKAL
ncbi:MAG: hypothetical protein ACI8P9_000953 [Parasphingorhabdus sp.]|jgi:hypothetical protein